MKNLQDLSRLRLGDQEERELAEQLEQILEYVSHLSSIDTSDVDPDLGMAVTPESLRKDSSQPGVAHTQIEQFAVEFQEGHFIVPRVLGDDTHA